MSELERSGVILLQGHWNKPYIIPLPIDAPKHLLRVEVTLVRLIQNNGPVLAEKQVVLNLRQ